MTNYKEENVFVNEKGHAVIRLELMPEELGLLFETREDAEKALWNYLVTVGVFKAE